MRRFFGAVLTTSRALHVIAGASLVSLMFLTVIDVLLRAFRKPIPGTYELVGFAGAVAIGFAIPYVAWHRGNVYVDTFLARLPKKARPILNILTRLLAIGLFFLLGWNLAKFGLGLRASGEVSPTLELRFYPVAFGLAAASFLQVIVLFCDIVKVFRGEYE
jgi:TRAP-type C4-dicarboxylate transport system permease small subunit